MPNLDNPASRVYTILDELRRATGPTLLGVAYAAAFGLEEADDTKIIIALGEFAEQVSAAETAILRLPINHAAYLVPFEPIRQLFKLGLSHQVNNAQSILTDTVITALQFCGETLSQMSPEKTLGEDQLLELRTNLLDFHRATLESEIDLELKQLILDHVNALLLAIEHYRIVGASGIQEVAEGALGALRVYAESRKGVELPDNDYNAANKLWNIAWRVVQHTSNLATLLSAGTDIAGYLLD